MQDDNDSNLQDAVRELLDKEEIRGVIHRFCRGADRRDRELVQSCYHPDATDNHGAYNGPGLGFYDAANAVAVQEVLHHHIGQIVIQLRGDIAKVETYCLATLVHEGQPSTLVCRYLDRFEKRGGKWKIGYRFVAFDAALGEGGMGPVPASNKGRRDREDYSYLLFGEGWE